MRIITGRSKGIRLNTLSGNDTRPTSERSKEAVFSALQFEIEGREVLDLFAGSGQLGLEAASRGASRAVLADSSREAYKIISENTQKSRLTDVCEVLCEDFESYLKKRAGREKYDIVFLDPPYATDFIDRAVSLLFDGELLKPTSLIVCESDREDVLSDANLSRLTRVKGMKHGIAHISIFKLNEVEK